MFRRSALLIGFILSLCLAASAQDAWVQPSRGPEYRILYGSRIAGPYAPGKVSSVRVFDSFHGTVSFEQRSSDKGTELFGLNGKPSGFLLEFDNGYWVDLGGKPENLRLSQTPGATDPSRSLIYSKTLMAFDPWTFKATGQKLELVPQPFNGKLRPGSSLKLQLLADGKPLPGQLIQNNSNEKGPKTDAKGMVTVTLVSGVNRFSTQYSVPQKGDADARRLQLTASLVFISE